jgi:hypothetical protein
MDTTENLSFAFHSMTDDFASALRALWREQMNRTLEGIESMRLPIVTHFERFIIIISAAIALRHNQFTSALVSRAAGSLGVAEIVG